MVAHHEERRRREEQREPRVAQRRHVGQQVGQGRVERAEAPRELAKRQAAAWQPLLDWARARYHAALTTTVGVMAIDQDSNALARLRKAVEAENDFTLAGLHIATAISGSLVVGLALMEKEIDAERAWQVSHIEEHWQLERWGEDEELSDRLAAMRQEFHEAENFIALARV